MYEQLHVVSYQTLRQLWKLHGYAKLMAALREIEEAAQAAQSKKKKKE